MVVPPLAFKESEIRFPTIAAFVAVIVDVKPLGVTTLEGASFPLGSAQFIPRKPLVFTVAVPATATEVESGFCKTASFFEQPAKTAREQINRTKMLFFI
jgi:hypothetical protein